MFRLLHVLAVALALTGTSRAAATLAEPVGTTSPLNSSDRFPYSAAAQTITFPPPAGPAYVGTSVLLAATGGASGNPVVFSVVSGPAMVSGANGSTLTYIGPGTVVVEADQAGGGGDPPAAPVQITLNPVVLTVPVGADSGLIPTLVTFQTAGTLFSIRSSTQGLLGGDFYLGRGGTCGQPSSYAAGDTCTMQFGFTPTHPGQRRGGAVFTSASGTVLATAYFYGVGTGPQVTFPPGTQKDLSGTVSSPAGITVDGSGDVFVATYGSGLYEIPASGQPRQIGSFTTCQDVAVDGVGNVFVMNDKTTLSEVLAVNGTIPASPTIVTISTQFSGATSLKVDGMGDVYISTVGNPGPISEVIAVDGSIPASPTIRTISSAFNGATGVAVDSSGNVFVSDDVLNGAYELMAVNGSIPASPTIRTLATGLNLPSNITLDAAGDVFISDYGDGDVKEILAVDGSVPATNPTILSLGSGLVSPQGLFVDASGNLFVADSGLASAVELDFADPPTLNFAPTVVGQTSSDSPQTATLFNDGNAPLEFSVPAAATNPAISQGFTIDGASTCPRLTPGASAGQLAPSSFCSNVVSFTPTTVGTIAGDLVSTDNALNVAGANQIVPLNGVGLNLTAPTITFSVANQTLGTPPFTVAAVSNSPGAIAYSVVSGPATISGSTVTLTGAGQVELLASQAASGQYAAGTATATFNVAKEPQTIQFAALASPIPLGSTPVKLVATASSGLPVSFSVISGPATLSGNILTFTGAGTVVVAANQAGNAQYAAAPTVTQSVLVDPQPKVTLSATPNPVFLNNPVTLTATLAVTGPVPSGIVTFLDGSQPIGSANLTGATATLSVSTLALGTHSITASYGGNANYASAVSLPVAVVVEDFSLALVSPKVTIFHGGTATFLLNLTPASAAGTAATVNLAVDGYPEGSKLTITPTSIATGSGTTAVTVVIQTPNYPSGSADVLPLQRGLNRQGEGGMASAALLLAGWLLLPWGSGRRTRLRRAGRGLLIMLAFAGLAGLGGCGWGWATQQWTIQVTASSGQLSHRVTAILTSECKDGQPACPIVAP
jgi:hypothetical protein